MSRKELMLIRRAYLVGLRAGFNRAQAVMCSKADRWEREINDLQSEYEMLVGELRCARDEQAVQKAVTERAITAARLH